MRRFEIANWAERAFTPTRWVLWYGEGYSSTAVLIWAESLESALECLGEHLEGSSFLLTHGSDELSELMAEACGEIGLPWPIPDGADLEPYWQVEESAYADLTYTEAGYIVSYEWGIVAENPTLGEIHSLARS